MALLFPCLLPAQVIFSRRVYAEQGRSYREIWKWTAADGKMTEVTRTPRDHSQPTCSRDGKNVLFVSDNQTPEYSVWSLNLATGEERRLWQTGGAIGTDLIGVARDGAALVDKQWVVNRTIRTALFHTGAHPFRFDGTDEGSLVSPDGRRLARFLETPPAAAPSTVWITDTATGRGRVSIAKCGDPVWSPDGGRIACSEGFLTDAATGRTRVAIGRCELPRWSPDGGRVACPAPPEFFIADARTGREVERVRLPAPSAGYAPQELEWSPDGRKLLYGVSGENANSSAPQSDFLVLDVAAKQWTPAGTGNHGTWLPGRDAVVYSTPRELAALPPDGSRHVWSAQLAMFDLGTRRQTLLTSGVTNNDEPVVCGR